MKTQRQRQEEALERLEERVEFWKELAKGNEPLPSGLTYYSNNDLAVLAAKTKEEMLENEKALAARKIVSLTRDINNLKKKLEGIRFYGS